MISSNSPSQHHHAYAHSQHTIEGVKHQQHDRHPSHVSKHHPYPKVYSHSRRLPNAMEEDDSKQMRHYTHQYSSLRIGEREGGDNKRLYALQSLCDNSSKGPVHDLHHFHGHQSTYPSLTDEDGEFARVFSTDDEEGNVNHAVGNDSQLAPTLSKSLPGSTAAITEHRPPSFGDSSSATSSFTSPAGSSSTLGFISCVSSDTVSTSGTVAVSTNSSSNHSCQRLQTSTSSTRTRATIPVSSEHSAHLAPQPSSTSTCTSASTSTSTPTSTYSSSLSPSTLLPYLPSTSSTRVITSMGGPGIDPGPAPVPELTLPPLRAWTDQVMQRSDGNGQHTTRMNHHPLRTQSSDPHLHASSMMHRQHSSSPSHMFHHSPTLSHVGSINSSSGSSSSGASAIHHSSDHHTHSRYSTSSIASLPDLYMSSSSAPSSTTTSSSLSRVDSLSSMDYLHGAHQLRQSQSSSSHSSSYHRHYPSTAGSVTTSAGSSTSSHYGPLSHSSAASNLARATLNATLSSASKGVNTDSKSTGARSTTSEGGPDASHTPNSNAGQTNASSNTPNSTTTTTSTTTSGRRTTGSAGSEQGRNSTKRAAQNRAAQRAFRQRKDLYVKELERKAELLQVAEGKILHLMTRNRELESALAAVTLQQQQQQHQLSQHSQHLPPHPPQQPGAPSMPPATSMTTPPPPSGHSSLPIPSSHGPQGSPPSPPNHSSPTSSLVGPASTHGGPKPAASGPPPPSPQTLSSSSSSNAMTGVIHANGSREPDRDCGERDWKRERDWDPHERESPYLHDGRSISNTNISERSYMDRDHRDREVRERVDPREQRELDWERDREREREIEWHRERERDRSMIHEQVPRYPHYSPQRSDPSQPLPPSHSHSHPSHAASYSGQQQQQQTSQGGDYGDTYMDYRPTGPSNYTSSPPSSSVAHGGAPVRPTLNHYHSAHQLRHYSSIHSPSSPPLSSQAPAKFSSMEP